ncbi:MAG: transcription antitermination factor NusB [Enterococcaceae bacterium]|jgi:N utilization substance protein B|nr:transcription antitermination factor NusB [Enterococcaceae bacterium]MCI1919129.1 transcription antitermination factor NusB [Enterococcaceae bacterium]
MSKQKIARSEIREMAFQTLFPLDFDQEISKKDALETVISLEHANWLSEEGDDFVPAYLDTLVTGVVEHREFLDQAIQPFLKSSWTLKRLNKTDHLIMQLAIFEMNFVDEVPNKVALNEALELAKKYSDDSSRRFINGLLSSYMASLAKK